MAPYEHRQVSKWSFLLFVLLLWVVGIVAGVFPASWTVAAWIAGLAVFAVAFMSLRVHVDERRVTWSFTFGIPRGSIPRDDIVDVEIVTNRFRDGFGIHWTQNHGWLWNLSGISGVMIRRATGEPVTLGTDEPRELYEAIARIRPPRD